MRESYENLNFKFFGGTSFCPVLRPTHTARTVPGCFDATIIWTCSVLVVACLRRCRRSLWGGMSCDAIVMSQYCNREESPQCVGVLILHISVLFRFMYCQCSFPSCPVVSSLYCSFLFVQPSLVLSCLSCPFLSCPVISCHILSYPVLS